MTGPVLPETLRSTRFDLPVVGWEESRAALSGERAPGWHEEFGRRGDLDVLALAPRSPDSGGWGPRRVVRRFDALTIGTLLVAPALPADDGTPESEVSLDLVDYARGHGVETEVLDLLGTTADARGLRLRAAAHPRDPAALPTLAAAGFTQLRGSDEDGRLVMVRPLTPRRP